MKTPIIPDQLKGGRHDTVSMHCENTTELATDCYEKLIIRLKAINQWHTYDDKVKAEFTIINPETEEPTSDLEKGNLVRINIPSIGSASGHGYDWTKITDIQVADSSEVNPFFLFTLKPCPAPDDADGTIAHFYTEDSTNTFIVRRIDNCVYIEVHGRNEIENTADVPILDTVRNKTVAVGSKLGIGNINWLGVTKALLKSFKQ